MSDRLALESAIIDAEGAAAVHCVVEDALTGPHGAGWADLGLEPREGLELVVMTHEGEAGLPSCRRPPPRGRRRGVTAVLRQDCRGRLMRLFDLQQVLDLAEHVAAELAAAAVDPEADLTKAERRGLVALSLAVEARAAHAVGD